jgi:hypothetical protein
VAKRRKRRKAPAAPPRKPARPVPKKKPASKRGKRKLPRGFEPLVPEPRKKRPGIAPSSGGPGGRLRDRPPKEARRQIVDLMKRWRDKLSSVFPGKPKFVTDILHHINADRSVSCEFRIEAISKRISIDRLLLFLGMAMHGSAVNGAWLSMGFRFPPNIHTEDDITYKKLKGADVIRSHSRRFVKQLVAYIVQQARDLHEGYMHNNKRRAAMVFVRVWWNPLGKRPKRRYYG